MNENRPHILLVEDEPVVRTVAEDLLVTFGYTVTAVANGAEALAALEISRPDLIMSDVRMPLVDGFQLLEKVRADPVWQQIPFIIVSAKAESTDLRMGMSLGADDYVMKPYRPAELEKAIAVRLKRARRIKEAMANHQRFLTRILPHELRTPLTGVIGVGDLMADTVAEGGQLTPGELADYARILQQSGERLFRIVENFLLWSRLESAMAVPVAPGQSPFVVVTVSRIQVRELAAAVGANFKRQSDLHVDGPEETSIKVGTHDFEFVATHLIENAFRFSMPGSPVQVSIQVEAGMFRLRVADVGRGMTAEQIERVGLHRQFDREKIEQQGTGMGLMLATSYSRLSGGSLKLQSGADGKGLVALMSLPLALR